MHRAKTKSPLSIMDKRIPQNIRYKNTQSKIDSGITVNKLSRLVAQKEFLKRRDETFRRITCKCLAELFEEYEDTGKGSCGPEHVARMVEKDGTFILDRVPEVCGPRIIRYEADESEEYDVPYLILDTRMKEDFAINRIYRARSFPSSFVCRDYILPDMLKYKNQEDHLIILYGLDDKSAAQTAHVLVQRGFDNIYVLSGGIAEYAELYPSHIEGAPLPKTAEDPNRKNIKREILKMSSAMSVSGAKSLKSVSRARSSRASDKGSVVSNLSVAETVISKANARKSRLADMRLHQ